MEVIQSFNRPDLKVFFDAEELKTHLEDQNWKKSNLLLMSSGNFGQLDLQAIANKVAQ